MKVRKVFVEPTFSVELDGYEAAALVSILTNVGYRGQFRSVRSGTLGELPVNLAKALTDQGVVNADINSTGVVDLNRFPFNAFKKLVADSSYGIGPEI